MRDRELIAELGDRLTEAGLSGSFLVRNLDTGQEIALDPDVVYPIASLVKVPLAIAVLEQIRLGRLDGARQLAIAPDPDSATPPVGIGRFTHPARIAIDDLVYLAVSISDSAAADALFALVPPAEVDRVLTDAGIKGIAVRHPMRDLLNVFGTEPGPDGPHLVHALVIGARTPGGGHPVAPLDVSRANTGTARAFADLLQELWAPSALHPRVAARVRALMRDGVLQRRLGPDFISDATGWASKSGTLLNLRHDAGVVEHEDGETYVVVALTESTVPAAAQPAADAVIGRVARALHDHLRGL
ncbi:serine hydrolase [Catenulispora sp. NF23]|uniref:Serine hydrolase n=1 Tax=Catenulispora pinistramenti TaxID=2705254 RepID=A0ABS5KWA3_9ACTN|nr:serine hydrolase [Catenulispora pinistramenti]MBS2536225.1 serine hydrolase [Catenulispora pinistramenti]MBS2550279.1 serine hydrolase [Catenulispora pinistramenti]